MTILLDIFFVVSRKSALALKWPQESWVITVQSALKGRAQKCFNLLPESEGYAELKRLVLREYELRPESYRLKFRKNRKLSDSETYADYLRAKKLDLDKWLDIKDEYFILYDLILLEEFKRQLPSEVKVHLDDKEIKDPYEASNTADDYSICHRLTRGTGVSESHFKMGGNTRSQHQKKKIMTLMILVGPKRKGNPLRSVICRQFNVLNVGRWGITPNLVQVLRIRQVHLYLQE